MGLHCSVLTFLPVTPLIPIPTDCSIPLSPYLCVVQAALQPESSLVFFLSFFFELNPDDPVSGP